MIEHDGCDGCKHFEKYKEFPETTSAMPCFDCEMAHSQNRLKDKYEPMTNADRIRNMSDEELANITLCYDDSWGEYFTSDFESFIYHDEALKHELEWLQSEAKESEEE